MIHEMYKDAFLDAYVRYQVGDAGGTLAKLAEARYNLLGSFLHACLFCSRDPELSEEQRNEQIAEWKKVLHEQYIAAKFHADTVAESVRMQRMPKEEETRANRMLENAKESLLKSDPSINLDDINTGNVDVSDWYYELRPEEKPADTGPLLPVLQ
jgi:hypothetical protein